MRSNQVKDGLERMPNRALIHATGVTREQMKRPFWASVRALRI